MDAPSRVSSPLLRAGIILVIFVSSLAVNGLLVLWLWADGANFATMDRVQPGESGFLIGPLPDSYKWLLSTVLLVNVGVLLYLLAKKKLQYALSFTAGAAVPLGYLVDILASA